MYQDKMSKYFPAVFLALPLLLSACEGKMSPSYGGEDEIYVVADSAEYLQLKDALETTFEKVIYTPQPEKLFTLNRVPINELEEYQTRKNILIIAPLNSRSVTSDFIRAVVDTSDELKLISDKDFVITRPNLWAKDQLVMILAAPTIQDIEDKIFNNGDNLSYAFQKMSDSRLHQSLYNARYEKKEIEGKLLKNYGWVIYVPSDFKLALDKPENNIVWLKSSSGTDMESRIFIYWIDKATPEYLNEDSIRALRNRVTERYYRTPDDSGCVAIAADNFTTCEFNFNEKYALFTQGLWDVKNKDMGGPFINYTFFDENTGRIYMLDGSVFASKYLKRNLIHQLDVVLQSFMTDAEMTRDKREQLLDAVK